MLPVREDRECLQLREEGHTFTEIGVALASTLTTVPDVPHTAKAHPQERGPPMIRRIFLGPGRRVQHAGDARLALVGCHVDPRDYGSTRPLGYGIHEAANYLLGHGEYADASRFWRRSPGRLGRMPDLGHLSRGFCYRQPAWWAGRTSASPPARRSARSAWPGNWTGFTGTCRRGCTGSTPLRPASTSLAARTPC